jgi:succinyl-CoA synthetase alpha subunit
MSFGHAAAMIMHNDDSASAKRRVLAEAGVRVAATIDEIIPLLT